MLAVAAIQPGVHQRLAEARAADHGSLPMTIRYQCGTRELALCLTWGNEVIGERHGVQFL